MKKAVLVSCFNWYETRLKPIRDLLIDSGYDVLVLIADYDHIKKTSINKRYDECTYIHVIEYKKNLSVDRIKSHLMFAKQCSFIINDYCPDLIFCQVPPNKVAKYCADYKAAHPQSKLVLDIIDMWPESLPMMGNAAFFLSAWREWRDKAIKVADHVFTECSLYQERMNLSLDSNKMSTLYLYKDQLLEEREMISKHIDVVPEPEKSVKFAYLGSMNHIIDIEGICTVISAYIDSGYRCELHAIGVGENESLFRKLTSDTGCDTHFYGAVFDEMEKIRILAPCDYAFNMMKDEISVGLTIKSVDYLSYGLPLMNNIKGDTWDLVEQEGIGVNVKQPFIIPDLVDHRVVYDVYLNRFTKESFMKSVKCNMSRLIYD